MFPFPLCRRDEEKGEGWRAGAGARVKNAGGKKGKQQCRSGGGMLPGISKVRDHFAFGRNFLPFHVLLNTRSALEEEKRGSERSMVEC